MSKQQSSYKIRPGILTSIRNKSITTTTTKKNNGSAAREDISSIIDPRRDKKNEDEKQFKLFSLKVIENNFDQWCTTTMHIQTYRITQTCCQIFELIINTQISKENA